MIKVAISIGTLQVGGAEVFVYNLLKGLDYKKFRVLLIVLSKNHGTYLDRYIKKLPVKMIYMNKQDGFRPLTLIKVYKELKKFNPDILHGNIGGLIYFLPYVFFHNINMIYTVHTLANLEFGTFKRRIIHYLYHCKKIIFVAISNEIKKSILNTYKNMKRIKLINNGIDVTRFLNDGQKKYWVKSNQLCIGHVGRFEAVKNHQMIVQIFSSLKNQYPNLKLKLIGSGSLQEEVSLALNQYSDVVMIKETDKVGEELEEVDIFLMPSVYEGLPLSVIEAMASGTVIVASYVGGLKDLIKNNENGFLIKEVDNLFSYLEKIEYLINHKVLMSKISKNNISKAKRFDLKIMQEKYQELYLIGENYAKW